MIKSLFRYFDFRYYLRFAGLFLFFYLTYTFVIAASVPTGVYYPFVERFLNFPAVIRDGILTVSKLFLALLGYPTVIGGGRINSYDGYVSLFMAFPCYGLGVKSFWVAFVCAHRMSLKQKMVWSLIGVLTIFLLNCVRVTVMMIAMIEKWPIADYLGTNAHDLFNYICYTALVGLVLFFYRKAKTKSYSLEGTSIESAKPVIRDSSIAI